MPMHMQKHTRRGNVRCLNMEDCANAKIQCFEFVLIHREWVCSSVLIGWKTGLWICVCTQSQGFVTVLDLGHRAVYVDRCTGG